MKSTPSKYFELALPIMKAMPRRKVLRDRSKANGCLGRINKVRDRERTTNLHHVRALTSQTQLVR
jgi:hypothetical protein